MNKKIHTILIAFFAFFAGAASAAAVTQIDLASAQKFLAHANPASTLEQAAALQVY
jgi:spermidine/putrescine-binding protein